MTSAWTNPPVLGFAAFSGSGKTTLLANVLPLLAGRGLRIGVIKHSHHAFEIDRPGKDSHRLRKAGACQTLIPSPWRTAWIEENSILQEPRLETLLQRLERDTLDLILVEGFRHEDFPKIEVHRRSTGKPLLHTQDPSIIAVACDTPMDTPLTRLNLDDPPAVAEFIVRYMQTTTTGATT